MSEKAGWKSLRSLFSLICFFGFSSVMSGQDSRQQDEIQNLISNHIPVVSQNWEIHQDPVSGYIYFANSAGLAEYNGISSRLFTLPYKQGVRSVYVNKGGKIFTGSFEEFGYWENDLEGDLTYHSLAQGLDIPKNDEIWNIYEFKNSILFQSFTTIYRYDSMGLARIPGPAIMLFMFRAGDSFIVQVIGSGLYWFDGYSFDFIEGSEPFRSYKVHSVIGMGPDRYWICTASNGIYVFDGEKFHPLESGISDFLKEQTCNAGLSINDSLIVFGTILRGIVFCDEKGNIQKMYDYSNGLNNNTVLSLFRDNANGLWIGLDEGVNLINVSSPVTFYANFTGNLGTIYTAIRNKDLLYLGTNHGLFVADIRINKGDYSFSNLKIIPNSQGQVWKLEQFDDQILCGHNDGTFLLDQDKFHMISEVTGGWSIKPYNDLLLEGTYTGIISLGKNNNGKWTYRNRIQGFIEPSRSIEVDYLGFVWATHPHKGIYRLELNEEIDTVVNVLHFSSIADTASRIALSRINNQVVFMTSGNIYTFDYENKSFFPVKSLEAGLGEYIEATQIIPYEKSTYWFILGNKIALFDISRELEAKKILEFFHRFAELPSREQQIISLDQNTLLIPTRQAFATFDLTRLGREKTNQSVKISRLLFSSKFASITIIPGMSGNIIVPNRENNLTVFLANPSGFDLGDQEYWYRINELSEQWYKTTLDNFTFLNLKFGHYHLQVKAATGTEVTEIEFTVRRPNYLSTAAILIYLVVLAGLMAGGIKIFRLELNRHRKLIEYEVGKTRLESELDNKSYELMLTMRYLIEKNEIMTELHKVITLFKEQSSKYPQKFIRDMEKIIDNGLNSQTEEWKNAMNSLKLSQQGFFKKLLDKYPHFTPNDLRLCSYLRMNFTTKEIAKLLNISARAVEISRYRLRRKMNITHDVNLTEYLIRESEKE